jgi:hypothetical protein
MDTAGNNLPTTLTVAEASALAARLGAPGLSAQSIRRACDSGALPCFRVGHQRVRAVLSDGLLEFIESRRAAK